MERTYVFNSEGTGGGSKLDITALLPGMLGGGRNLDPNLLALMGNRNGFGGQDGWWSIIWLVVIASIFGWNGNGGGLFGGRGGNGCNSLPAELSGNAGRELLMQAIQGNGNAIAQLASAFNCSTQQIQTALCNVQNSITQVGNQVGLSTNQIINAMQSGNQAILTMLSDCCCKAQTAIERQGYENRLANCENMNTLTRTMEGNTRSLADTYREGFQALVEKMDAAEARRQQEALAAKDAEIAALKGEISQRNQNATILNAVGQQISPLAAGLQALQSDVDGIKCKLPNTVSVPYPNLTAINTDCFRAAAYGAYAGDAAFYGRGGYGCNGGYWG